MKQPTKREVDILNELVTGASNKEIARRLGMSSFTVREHLRHLEEKLECRNRVAMAVKWSNHLTGGHENPASGTALENQTRDLQDWPGPDSMWP